MAHRCAAPLIVALLFTGGCDLFYALGPNGCDETHACTNPERPRCDVAARRCLAPQGGADLAADGADAAEPDGPLCGDHSDCTSGVCDELGLTTVEPGRCIPDGAVTMVQGVSALRDALPRYRGVRLGPGTYQGDWIVALHNVVLVGPGALSPAGDPAILRPAGSGAVLRIGTRAQVMVDGLEVRGGMGANGHGIFCDNLQGRLAVRRSQITDNGGRGIWSRCPLQVTQTRIGGWDGHGNQGGGLLAEDVLSLTNSFITYNGSAFSDIGGITLRGNPNDPRILVNLTFVANQEAGDGVAANCDGLNIFIFRSLLVKQRTTDRPLLANGCQLAAAAVDDPAYFRADTVKIDGAHPVNFRGIFDFHIKLGSAAQDSVPTDDPGPRLPVDFDGDRRPQGAGFDFGADEVVP